MGRLAWATFLCALFSLSCGRSPVRSTGPGSARPAFGKTDTIVRETEMGTARIFFALPESGYDEVWFYFHGAGAVDASVVEKVERLAGRGGRAPAIVALTFGPRWTLTGPTEKRAFSATEVFWKEILPLVNERVEARARRVGIGYSQGGFNLLSLFADRPDFWDALVLINAAVAELSPASDDAAVKAYVARTRAYTPSQRLKSVFGFPLDRNIRVILEAWGAVSRSAEAWDRVEPIGRIASMPGRASLALPVLIACGRSDQFGFHEGSRRLAELLSADPNLRTDFYAGHHEDMPEAAVRDFLSWEAGVAAKGGRR